MKVGTHPNQEGEGSILFDWRFWFILCLAFILRCVWLFSYVKVIENEGAIYAGLAENIFMGKGYVWISGGRHTLSSPLYPLLIGAITYLAGSAETAGRLISLIMGTLLIMPMFLTTEILFGRRGGLYAAMLVAVHPMLIALSCAVYSESLFFTIWLLGIYFAMRTFREIGLRYAILTGLFFGFAYLVRPDAIIYPFLTVIFILWTAIFHGLSIRNALLRAVTVAFVAMAVAAPYVVWLSANSGYFRLEGKSVINDIISGRMMKGMTYPEAARGLGPNGEVEGPYLHENQFDLVPDGSSDYKALLRSVFHDLGHRGYRLGRRVISTKTLGSPVLIILACVGFLTARARKRRILEEGFLASIAVVYMFMLLSLQWCWTRFLFPVALLLIPWAGGGVSQIAKWIRYRGDVSEDGNSLWPRLAAWMAVCLILVCMVIPSGAAVYREDEFHTTRFTALRDAGCWLDSQRAGNKTIMGISAVLAYYAHATRMYLPYASESVALEYIHKKNPDYIVLRSDDQDEGPYIKKWLRSGIPDRCAKELRRYDQVDTLGIQTHREEMVIYSWESSRAKLQ